ncbi:MAG TPA: class I SAM-dependent methyltransferase [Burkholderiales bacterium]|nr:class I SAM-dependent methyltransferase [Burkholderiales bacterium]
MDLRSLLAHPRFYSCFASAVGGGARAQYARQYLRARPGERILDMGCGTADILDYLPAGVDYTGFDLSADYIAAARSRYGERGQFRNEPVDVALAGRLGSFDLAMANGVLHHLDDAGAHSLFELAKRVLAPGGRLVTLDGCFVPGQSRIARFLLSRDRGRFVRNEDEYLRLAHASFGRVAHDVRHDLLRIPYTLIIMECRL